MLVILLPLEALDRWTAVSAQGIVAEGIAKREIWSVSRSWCGSGGMRRGSLELLNYFRNLDPPHTSNYSFTCTLDSKTIKCRRKSYFILFLKHKDHQNQSCNFGL